MLKLGIDDAGRGPVIGPMVLSGVLIDKEIEKEFEKFGVKDSKMLTPKRRKVLADIIKKKAISYKILIAFPEEIDSFVGKKVNLNHLEAIKSAELINKINKKLDKIEVAIDCPSPNIKKWKDYLLTHLKNPKNIQLKVEHKADKNHLSCSAASILAKTTRDKEIDKIKKKIGIDFGSGYSSDPITIDFIKKHSKKYKDKGFIRKSWQTWKNNNSKKEQKNLKSFFE